MKKTFDGHNLIVPGIEKVSAGPAQNEIRYFSNTDETKKLANGIVAILNEIDTTLQVSAKFVPGYEASDKIRPNHFELWVTPDAK
jgi:hypothetical protein